MTRRAQAPLPAPAPGPPATRQPNPPRADPSAGEGAVREDCTHYLAVPHLGAGSGTGGDAAFQFGYTCRRGWLTGEGHCPEDCPFYMPRPAVGRRGGTVTPSQWWAARGRGRVIDLEGANGARNNRFTDAWSLVHAATGFGWGLVTRRPVRAYLLMALWEPFEVLVLSPWLEKRHRVIYGKEGWKNVLGDLLYDAVGLLAARALVARR